MDSRFRPDWLQRRIDLEEERREHRKRRLAGCQCPDCIGVAGVTRLIEQRLAANPGRGEEVPF